MPHSGTPALPQGVVTFLMTDIEASTRHWSRHGDAMERALPRHDDILREHIERCGGHVLKHRNRGDSFFAVFDRASGAVNAAAAFQRTLQREDWEEGVELRVRTGIHSGEAVLREGDYYGDAVNRCSRLCDVAHGGQVVVTSATRSLCDGGADGDIRFRPLGPQLLEGLDERVEVFQLVHAELHSDFPPLRTRENVPNNLPRSLSSFVGRASELSFLEGLVKKSRLVTLVGPGGVGKTRLAIEYGRQHLRGFPGGVWLVQLGGVGADESVADALADTMSVREYGGASSLEAVVNEIGAEEALVILDNCEHVRRRGMRCAYELLERCPKLSILATSREPFGVQWEQQFYVPVLDLPPEANGQPEIEELVRIDAVSLLLERARAFDAGFQITERNRDAIVRLVRTLDGVPLALELVASLVTTLSVDRILERLKRFPLRDLATQDPTVEDRHRSVRLMIEWSYQLLEERERLFFLRLSVFPDTFDLEAAEAICAGGPIEADDVLGLLASMVRKSLVSRVGNGGGLRYRMLWAIRQFAREEYARVEEREDLWSRHSKHYADFALLASERLVSEEADDWVKRIETELPSLRQSLETLRQRGEIERALSAAGSLWRFWYTVSRYTEGRAEIDRCIEVAGPDERSAALAEALHGSGTLATYQVDFDAALRSLQQALEIWRELDDEGGALRTLANIAAVELQRGNVESALSSWETSLEILERRGDDRSAAIIRHNLAVAYGRSGRFEDSLAAAQESHQHFVSIDEPSMTARCAIAQAAAHLKLGEAESAIPLLDEALRSMVATGDMLTAGEALVYIAHARFELDQVDLAFDACNEALTTLRKYDTHEFYVQGLRRKALLHLERDEIEEARRLLFDAVKRFGAADDPDNHQLEQHVAMGELELREGAFARCRSIVSEAVRIARRRPAAAELGDVLLVLSELVAEEGDLVSASRVLALSRRLRRECGTAASRRLDRRESELETLIKADLVGADFAQEVARADAWTWRRAHAEIDALLSLDCMDVV